MMPMKNTKGAIELSMNMLVMIIISIVILAGGMVLLYKFIGGAEDIKSQLDTRTDSELERLLVDQGKQVALPLHTATVTRGGSYVFGIGILNTGNKNTQFNLQAKLAKFVDEQGVDQTSTFNALEIQEWLLYDHDMLTVKENEHRKESILVHIPTTAAKGQYIFMAEFMTPMRDEQGNQMQYGNTQTFTVTVT